MDSQAKKIELLEQQIELLQNEIRQCHHREKNAEVEKALKESENRLRLFIDHAPVALAMFDRNMCYLYYSNRWLQDFKLEGRDIRGLNHYEVFPEITQAWREVHQRAQNGEVLEDQEDKFVRADGTVFWKHWEVRPWMDADGQIGGIVVMTEDVTARVNYRNELKRLNADLEKMVQERTAQLEASNKELEAFSYSVSHDLRAPLRHINGYVDLLNQKFKDDLPEKAQHYLETISDSTKQMGVLIDELLQFSRTGRQALSTVKVDMNELLASVIEKYRNELIGRDIEWSIQSLPPVMGDYSLLRQVWANLIDNAVKYTRKKDVARISVGYSEEEDYYVFFVRDNGVGFDMKYAGKMFGVFQRMHSSADFEGTGIGLANVRSIISKHNGKVWAEAEVDKGATFYFSIVI